MSEQPTNVNEIAQTAKAYDSAPGRNLLRVELLYCTLREYARKKGLWEAHEQDWDTTVSDMLADLRHFCDVYRIDFTTVDNRGYEHYGEECRELREEQRNMLGEGVITPELVERMAKDTAE